MARCCFARGATTNNIFCTHLRKFSYASLVTATDNFSDDNLIGEGGFAKIYKAVLADASVVAVKKYKPGKHKFDILGIADVMSHCNHRNINKVIGFCIEKGHRLLISEYEENKSVYELLHDRERKGSVFKWDVRASVIMGVARGLCYLHEDTTPRVIHRDVTTSNILLNAKFVPKISDFDLSVFLHDSSEGSIVHSVMGTWPYMDPNYILSGALTEKVDVYGFGVVMLEIISGRDAIIRSHDIRPISVWASKLMESQRVMEIVDPALHDLSADVARGFIDVALWCTRHDSKLKPSMGEIVFMLQGVCNSGVSRFDMPLSYGESQSFKEESSKLNYIPQAENDGEAEPRREDEAIRAATVNKDGRMAVGVILSSSHGVMEILSRPMAVRKYIKNVYPPFLTE